MSPKHSIGFCPVCGGGLCGIRICRGDGEASGWQTEPHGLVVCDECEAIWLEPDLGSDHQYPDPECPCCPICRSHLWCGGSQWADRQQIETLGWSHSVDHHLDRS